MTPVTKSNGMLHTMPFRDDVVAAAAEAPGLELPRAPVDALAAALVLRLSSFDACNLLRGVDSDLVSAVTGSIGLTRNANLNPSGDTASMFEPVHGAAHDIAGKESPTQWGGSGAAC